MISPPATSRPLPALSTYVTSKAFSARESRPWLPPPPGGARGASRGANFMKFERCGPELWSGRGPRGGKRAFQGQKNMRPPQSPPRLAPTGRGPGSSGSGSAPGAVCRFSGRGLTVSCAPPGAAPLLVRGHSTAARPSCWPPKGARPRLLLCCGQAGPSNFDTVTQVGTPPLYFAVKIKLPGLSSDLTGPTRAVLLIGRLRLSAGRDGGGGAKGPQHWPGD